MTVYIDRSGTARMIYTDELDLATVGPPTIRRASHVEPAPGGGWTADLSPVGGPTLGPFPTRREALAEETSYLLARSVPVPD